MRLWEENDLELFHEEEEQVPQEEKKSWKTEFNKRAKAIMGDQERGECLVLSFNMANSKNLRQDYGVMVRYLQNLFKAGHLDFKRFGLVFWDDSNSTVFGPYPFNSNRNMKSFIFNKMQAVMKQKKKEAKDGEEDTANVASYDYALCPFFKNSSTESESAGQLSAFRQKVSMIVVFTGSELEDPADPVAKAWARRMRDRTIYILKQGTRGKAKDFKKYDPDWQKHYVLIPKGGSPKNEDMDIDAGMEEYDCPDYNRFDEYLGFSKKPQEADPVQESYEKGFDAGFRAYQMDEAANPPAVSIVLTEMMEQLDYLHQDNQELLDTLSELQTKKVGNIDIAKLRSTITGMRDTIKTVFSMTNDLTKFVAMK